MKKKGKGKQVNKPKKSSLREFFNETNLEGWKYLNLENPIWRFIW
jgi:hypothetical protein